MMVAITLVLFAVAAALIGTRLHGLSLAKQAQSGMFFGFALGCVLVIMFGGVL